MKMKELRLKSKLSQVELSMILSCSQSLYSMYESGSRNVPVDILIKLSYLYDTSLDYIVGITDNPIPSKRNKLKPVYVKYWKYFETEGGMK